MTLAPAETAARLANVLDVLREAVHLTAGRLPLEPRFEVKAPARRPPARRRAARCPGCGAASRSCGGGPTAGPARSWPGCSTATSTARSSRRWSPRSTRTPTQLDPLAEEPPCSSSPSSCTARSGTSTELPADATTTTRRPRRARPSARARPAADRHARARPPGPRQLRRGRSTQRRRDQHYAHALMDAKLCAAELLRAHVARAPGHAGRVPRRPRPRGARRAPATPSSLDRHMSDRARHPLGRVPGQLHELPRGLRARPRRPPAGARRRAHRLRARLTRVRSHPRRRRRPHAGDAALAAA